ncbi:MAG: PhoX family protein [Gemmatimonadaceae bacterium]|nr:PhoX family protein [Gemmatimonadaceae bacterium]
MDRTTSLAALSMALLAAACSDDNSATAGDRPAESITLQNRSNTPALVRNLLPGARAFSLIASDDTLRASPNFVFGGSADGAGFLRNADGTFTLLTNHEDNFAVSRVTFDAQLRPVSGEYAINSTHGRWRLCSATLATPREHGFGPMFFTVGESGIESEIHAMNPFAGPNTSRTLPAFGNWNGEQALPLPSQAYPNRTVVVIGDDDSGPNGGQVAMYVSDRVGDLDGGKLYVLARTDNNIRERDMVVGQTYPIEFREIENASALTGAQIETVGRGKNMMRFARVEDIDYRKGSAENNRELYFIATGQNNTGENADFSRTKYGRVYRLRLDAASPLRGTIEVVLDGDDRNGPARQFQNPDNIYAGERFVYVQEDPNGYGDETHDSYIYQYTIASRELRVAMELDHRRTAADANRFNVGRSGSGPSAVYSPRTSTFGSWEYGAMIDVSTEIGIPDAFIISIQPHTWIGRRYQNADGGTLRPNEDQASQMILVTGLPR